MILSILLSILLYLCSLHVVFIDITELCTIKILLVVIHVFADAQIFMTRQPLYNIRTQLLQPITSVLCITPTNNVRFIIVIILRIENLRRCDILAMIQVPNSNISVGLSRANKCMNESIIVNMQYMGASSGIVVPHRSKTSRPLRLSHPEKR